MRDRLIEEPNYCDYCCNFDKEHIGMDGTAICKLTNKIVYSEDGGDCPFFNVPKERIIVPPCKVGDKVYVIEPLWYGIWGENEHKCRKCEHFYEGGMGDNPDCTLGKNCCYHIVEEEADLRSLANWITPSRFTEEIAWGKTVFFTREEAEQALEERTDK